MPDVQMLQTCFFFYHSSSYFERLKLVRSGAATNATTRKVRRKSLAFDLALEWFRTFARNADHLPNSSSRPLPACLSKRAVYTMYKEEMAGKPVLSRSHFLYKMWRVNFLEVYIPKV